MKVLPKTFEAHKENKNGLNMFAPLIYKQTRGETKSRAKRVKRL